MKSYFHEQRTRVFHLTYAAKSTKNIPVKESDFQHLLYNGGLASLLKHVQGYKAEGKGTFKVTFFAIPHQTKLFQVLTKHKTKFKSSTGTLIEVDMSIPMSPIKTVTLKPVPLEYDLTKLEEVLVQQGWGSPLQIIRGHHKQVGHHRPLENEFVYVKYAELQENLVPPALILDGHRVKVSLPGGINSQCSYCNGYFHTEEHCMKKKEDESMSDMNGTPPIAEISTVNTWHQQANIFQYFERSSSYSVNCDPHSSKGSVSCGPHSSKDDASHAVAKISDVAPLPNGGQNCHVARLQGNIGGGLNKAAFQGGRRCADAVKQGRGKLSTHVKQVTDVPPYYGENTSSEEDTLPSEQDDILNNDLHYITDTSENYSCNNEKFNFHHGNNDMVCLRKKTDFFENAQDTTQNLPSQSCFLQ